MMTSRKILSVTLTVHQTFPPWVQGKQMVHDDVIKWKHFPRYWPFVRGIHRPPMNSPDKGQWRSFDVFCDVRLNKQLSKQSIRRRFETPLCSLWRHCNAIADVLFCRLYCRSCLFNPVIYVGSASKCLVPTLEPSMPIHSFNGREHFNQ